MADKINVLIVDDDPDWIRLIRNDLENVEDKDFFVTGTAGSKKTAIELCRNIKEIDVVLMDINLSGSGVDGIEAVSEILEFRQMKFIMLTCLDETELVMSAGRNGAIGYLLKSQMDKLPMRIRLAHAAGLPENIWGSKIREQMYEIVKYELLTKEEKNAYDLKEQGRSVEEIASMLFKSTHTIKNQVSNLYKRFGVRDFGELQKKLRDKVLSRKDV